MAFQINSLTITKILLLAPFFLGFSSVGAAPVKDIADAIADAIADGQIAEVAKAIAQGVEEGLAKADNNNGTTTSDEFLQEGERCLKSPPTGKKCDKGLECFKPSTNGPITMYIYGNCKKPEPASLGAEGEGCRGVNKKKCAEGLVCTACEPGKPCTYETKQDEDYKCYASIPSPKPTVGAGELLQEGETCSNDAGSKKCAKGLRCANQCWSRGCREAIWKCKPGNKLHLDYF